ncbi:MAG: YciI family protein [Candidatus Polarisedimenticolia bacterium]
MKEGHWLDGGAALQLASSARTLRWKNGKVVVTDGPYAETKEVLGGLGLLEARDMNHAVELISKHPGVRIGPFEIRPVDEKFTARIEERWRRLEKAAGK